MAKPISITLEQLISFHPCNLYERVHLFGQHKSINVKQALKLGVSIEDILWVASRMGYKRLCVRFSLLVAQRAAVHTKDPRVQKALDTVRDYLEKRIDGHAAQSAAQSAAWSARSAAWSAKSAARSAAQSAAESAESAAESAAWSARSAESAAWSTRSAAWSAKSAAWSARSAAWSAKSASRSAEVAEQKLLLIQVFSGEFELE